MIIDVHTHAFPDAIAARAIARLEVGNCKAKHDGTVAGLLRSMDRAGIDRAVICSIATKPEQFGPILKWSREIASDRLIPLGSVHPADPDKAGRVRELKDAGMKGIKLHPYYQDFDLMAEALFPLYEAMAEAGLVLVSHTGYDMAFPPDGRAAPDRILRVMERFPGLRFVATHFGAWRDWVTVGRRLVGKPLLMEIALSLEDLPASEARAMLMAHPAECLMFGTDSPWGDQAEAVALLRALDLPAELQEKILWRNAARVFG
jgi:predicted TIM-barrel fold metal-dependent hydrolase